MPDPAFSALADIKIGVSLPFEALAIEMIKAWSQARANMNEKIRDRWDLIGVEMAEYLVAQIKRAVPPVVVLPPPKP